jgi:hypothetical protein
MPSAHLLRGVVEQPRVVDERGERLAAGLRVEVLLRIQHRGLVRLDRRRKGNAGLREGCRHARLHRRGLFLFREELVVEVGQPRAEVLQAACRLDDRALRLDRVVLQGSKGRAERVDGLLQTAHVLGDRQGVLHRLQRRRRNVDGLEVVPDRAAGLLLQVFENELCAGKRDGRFEVGVRASDVLDAARELRAVERAARDLELRLGRALRVFGEEDRQPLQRRVRHAQSGGDVGVLLLQCLREGGRGAGIPLKRMRNRAEAALDLGAAAGLDQRADDGAGNPAEQRASNGCRCLLLALQAEKRADDVCDAGARTRDAQKRAERGSADLQRADAADAALPGDAARRLPECLGNPGGIQDRRDDRAQDELGEFLLQCIGKALAQTLAVDHPVFDCAGEGRVDVVGCTLPGFDDLLRGGVVRVDFRLDAGLGAKRLLVQLAQRQRIDACQLFCERELDAALRDGKLALLARAADQRDFNGECVGLFLRQPQALFQPPRFAVVQAHLRFAGVFYLLDRSGFVFRPLRQRRRVNRLLLLLARELRPHGRRLNLAQLRLGLGKLFGLGFRVQLDLGEVVQALCVLAQHLQIEGVRRNLRPFFVVLVLVTDVVQALRQLRLGDDPGTNELLALDRRAREFTFALLGLGGEFVALLDEVDTELLQAVVFCHGHAVALLDLQLANEGAFLLLEDRKLRAQLRVAASRRRIERAVGATDLCLHRRKLFGDALRAPDAEHRVPRRLRGTRHLRPGALHEARGIDDGLRALLQCFGVGLLREVRGGLLLPLVFQRLDLAIDGGGEEVVLLVELFGSLRRLLGEFGELFDRLLDRLPRRLFQQDRRLGNPAHGFAGNRAVLCDLGQGFGGLAPGRADARDAVAQRRELRNRQPNAVAGEDDFALEFVEFFCALDERIPDGSYCADKEAGRKGGAAEKQARRAGLFAKDKQRPAEALEVALREFVREHQQFALGSSRAEREVLHLGGRLAHRCGSAAGLERPKAVERLGVLLLERVELVQQGAKGLDVRADLLGADLVVLGGIAPALRGRLLRGDEPLQRRGHAPRGRFVLLGGDVRARTNAFDALARFFARLLDVAGHAAGGLLDAPQCLFGVGGVQRYLAG